MDGSTFFLYVPQPRAGLKTKVAPDTDLGITLCKMLLVVNAATLFILRMMVNLAQSAELVYGMLSMD